jgi:hypothetical protein
VFSENTLRNKASTAVPELLTSPKRDGVVFPLAIFYGFLFVVVKVVLILICP